MNEEVLIREALHAREQAYAPYSRFAVGAALLCEDGRIFHGCNVENASFSPTCCAERVAIFRAVAEGVRSFRAIAVVGGPMGSSPSSLCTPCGVCRQVLSEFCGPDFEILLSDLSSPPKKYRLCELMPHAFSLERSNDEA